MAKNSTVIDVIPELGSVGVLTFTATLPADLHAGDCTMFAGSQAEFYDANPQGGIFERSGIMNASVATSHSWSGDVWHQSFELLDVTDSVLMRVGPFSGPDMYPGPNPYGMFNEFTFAVVRFADIRKVRWIGDC